MKKRPFAEQVAQNLIEQLEQGTAPFIKPWKPGEPFLPYNPISGKTYRGINTIMLMLAGSKYSDNRWLTYKQAQSLGAQIRKGERGTVIQYWKWREETIIRDTDGNPVTDEDGNVFKMTTELEQPRVFHATVFNAEQADGMPAAQQRAMLAEWERIPLAEQMLSNLGARISHISGDHASYSPATDTITLPEQGQFQSADQYYSVALHEGAHATGHPDRLDRDIRHPFGSPDYAREEMRAEIASMILGEQLSIGYDPGQHAAYVGHWVEVLKKDPLEIFRAASDAEKIVRFMRQLVPQLREEAVQESRQPVASMKDQPVSQSGGELATERTYLIVPYAEKNDAKTLGAKWDRNRKSWYIPEGAAVDPFARWERQALQGVSGAKLQDPQAEFADALQAAGLELNGPPVMDGKLRRVPVEGDRRGEKSGAYVGHLDGRPSGYIQNFKQGTAQNWKSAQPTEALTDANRARLQQEVEANRARRAAQAKANHDETVRLLVPFLLSCMPADNHPYLRAKAIGSHGLTVSAYEPLHIFAGEDKPQLWGRKDDLIIPLRNAHGELVGAQSIGPDGRKSFPRGCQWRGGMHLIAGQASSRDTLVIAEGYATAATIHEQTGLPVAAALSAGNLEVVAMDCEKSGFAKQIIIAGDNDHTREREIGPDGKAKKNAGKEYALKAAQAVGGIIALPAFKPDDRGTDWNDLLRTQGKKAWLSQWKMQVQQPAQSRKSEGQIVEDRSRRAIKGRGR